MCVKKKTFSRRINYKDGGRRVLKKRPILPKTPVCGKPRGTLLRM